MNGVLEEVGGCKVFEGGTCRASNVYARLKGQRREFNGCPHPLTIDRDLIIDL
jgi:hypothetical protein